MSEQSERDAIMRAAYRLISRGSDSTRASTSIEKILQAAGVNRRIFYRHFASKDDLIIAMQEWAGELILTELQQAVDTATTPAEAVAAWIEHYLSIGWQETRFRDALAFMSTEVAGAPGIGAGLEATYARHREVLTAALTEGLADGSLPNARPELDSFAIHAVAVRHLEARIRGRLGTDFDEVRNQMTRLILTGLSAAPVEP
ncbi:MULTISPECIES: TetR/AcrR family transcriptional regulator [Mycolicibacterium]|jgi:AcrR family transcriptional regulator|uniref:TetR/AcrR family transcriptional regulator n=3 Tax=Mycolicibacterium TaxID=1866885 RepID=A0AAE4VGW3_MYCFO|nr:MULTISPECIES: TetR/AcrR family transcriptional regulator [Mycolicibacterium]MCV7142421.1 TetR/AcrR family transcriptional regulator [Mycolicibacterium fortuitum]MDV7194531.1 TetR/AcrR family transcriptional regulator [Mycolicibacterium fortuitum]MDV7208093.1 TetR/AcrR family transcriptional regulator [Mycolicibacterium fortuitum]MDV7229987.1 TetR/AcrR family transcriptional regulator [Mycolicibacterium fortuitum]MDV7261792.1 TetR/AcrR family transcriptional regulator [Mycolicibacterium fort